MRSQSHAREKPEAIRAKLSQLVEGTLEIGEFQGSIVLEGQAASWDQKIAAGWAAAKFGYRSVVNHLSVPGVEDSVMIQPNFSDGLLEGQAYDIVVVGGGVVGCAIARELSRYDLSIALLEKEYDVAVHTSSRNDGMIHDGFAARPGTKKAAYNVRGNRLWEPLCKELGLSFHRPGSLVVFRSPLSALAYPLMAARARENSVAGWEFWSRARLQAEEPNITGEQHGAFFLPSAGVLSPYKATVALAENAVQNGVRLVLNCCVSGFSVEQAGIHKVHTNRGTLRAGVVVNAAGNWADKIAELAGDGFFSLHQRRGSELILDSNTAGLQKHILGMPSLLQLRSKTKGGGLVPTVEGNILVGPTAREIPGREDYATDVSEMRELERHLRINRRLSLSQVITYFAGVRPCTYDEDFIVEKSRHVGNLIHAAGIQSPGLASAPAIALDIARLALECAGRFKPVREKSGWRAGEEKLPELKRAPASTRAELIARDPAYGRIVCRCEEVSEGEIRDAIKGIVPATSLDAIKRRTRAGMGRCHGGFCTPRVMHILAETCAVPMTALTKRGAASWLVYAQTKDAALRQRPDQDSGKNSGQKTEQGLEQERVEAQDQ